jgi:hypothetical protein
VRGLRRPDVAARVPHPDDTAISPFQVEGTFIRFGKNSLSRSGRTGAFRISMAMCCALYCTFSLAPIILVIVGVIRGFDF